MFRIWYKSVPGYGEKAPTVATFQTDTNGGTIEAPQEDTTKEDVTETKEPTETPEETSKVEDTTTPEPTEKDPEPTPTECIGTCPEASEKTDTGTVSNEETTPSDKTDGETGSGTDSNSNENTDKPVENDEDPEDDQAWLDDFGLTDGGKPVTPEDGSTGTNQVIEANNKVTVEPLSEEKETLSSGVMIAIVLGVLVCILPAVIYVTLKLIAKYRPNSKIGRKFNAWKERRALNAQ